MEQERFEALVERLTRRARIHPLRYRLEVLALAAAGYLYLLLLALGAVLVSVALALVCLFKPILLLKLLKLVWLPIWFAWSVLRALWVRIDAPQGRELKAQDAPRLFAEIERIRASMGAPRPHKVLLTDEYNAAVSQVPRLGLFGWPRSYLIVGLPLMATLDSAQFSAVLAHEFGHLSAGDSRMNGRLYQMRITWARVQQQFERRGGYLVRPFMRRFVPYFNAYSFVLARAQEYAADGAASRIVGAEAAAGALVLAGIGDDFQQRRIWQPLWERVRLEEQPSLLPYGKLLQEGRATAAWSDAGQRLQQALEKKTDWSDTHPALAERLSAIGVAAQLPASAQASAAETLLGELAPRLAQELDDRWKAAVADNWRKRYRQADEQRTELAALRAGLQQAQPDREKAWRLACLTEQVEQGEAALPLYQSFLQQYPDAAGAQFAIGRLLLDRGDASGLHLLDQVMQADAGAIKPCAETAFRYLQSCGRQAEAERYRQAWLDRDRVERESEAERARFTAQDSYEPHGLDADTAARLAEELQGVPGVGKAWLVRKRLQHFSERPAYLLLANKRLFDRTGADAITAALSRLPHLPEGAVAGVYNRNLAQLRRRVKSVQGGLLYQRPWF